MLRVVGFGLRVYVGRGAQGLWSKVYDLGTWDVVFGVLSCCQHINPMREIHCGSPLGDYLGMQRSNQQCRLPGCSKACVARLEALRSAARSP